MKSRGSLLLGLTVILIGQFFIFNFVRASEPTGDLSVKRINIFADTVSVKEPVLLTVEGEYTDSSATGQLTDSQALLSVGKDFPDFVAITKMDTGNIDGLETARQINENSPLLDGSSIPYIYIGFFTSPGDKLLSFTIDKNNLLAETNEANNSATSTVSVTPEHNASQMTVSGVTVTDLTSNAASVSWKTNLSGTTSVIYWPQGSNEAVAGELSGLILDHKVILNQLKPRTVYNYYVFSLAADSTAADSLELPSSPIQTFTTADGPEAPVVEPLAMTDVNAIGVGDNGLKVTWTTNRPSNSVLFMSPLTAASTEPIYIVQTDLVSNHEITLNTLIPNTKYAYVLNSIDAQGYRAYSQQFYYVGATVEPQPRPDPIPMDENKITDFQITELSAVSATIKWQTTVPSRQIVKYMAALPNNDPILETTITKGDENTGEFTLDHSLVLSELKPNTRYYIYIQAIDQDLQYTVLPAQTLVTLTVGGSTDGEREIAKQVVLDRERRSVRQDDNGTVNRVKGRILLQVQEKGEAWYVDPVSGKKFYLADGQTAYEALRKFGLGISNKNLDLIPVGVMWDEVLHGDVDSDHDGLGNKLESALGTDPNNLDSDNDSYTDAQEIRNGYSPLGTPKMKVDAQLVKKLSGRILIQTEHKGEAWYVNPVDGKRYFLGNGEQAYQLMRKLSLGITNIDLRKIDIGQ